MINIDDSIIQTFIKNLPRVFDEVTYIAELDQLAAKHKIQNTLYKRLFKACTKIQLHWNKKTVRSLYTFQKDYSILDLLSAWSSRRSYLSHFSGLYFNNLVDQKPNEYFLSTEVKLHKNSSNNELNTSILRQSFMKGYKIQQNFCYFNGIKIHFVEKADLNQIGVEGRYLNIDNIKIHLNLTSVERSLIDSVIAPQYSGGMENVRAAFIRSEIDMQRLINVYTSMSFAYPYWQTIGLLLELTKNSEVARTWESVFGKPKIDFYYDRNYRTDWILNNRWRVFLPKGIYSGN